MGFTGFGGLPSSHPHPDPSTPHRRASPLVLELRMTAWGTPGPGGPRNRPDTRHPTPDTRHPTPATRHPTSVAPGSWFFQVAPPTRLASLPLPRARASAMLAGRTEEQCPLLSWSSSRVAFLIPRSGLKQSIFFQSWSYIRLHSDRRLFPFSETPFPYSRQ